MGQTEVRVQRETFDLIALDQLLQSDGARCGAVVTFTGRVRDLENTELRALELEHYPEMAPAMINGRNSIKHPCSEIK